MFKHQNRTRNAFEEIDQLVEGAYQSKQKVFHLSTRELATMYGVSNGLVYTHLLAKDKIMYPHRRRWYFRHNEARHE